MILDLGGNDFGPGDNDSGPGDNDFEPGGNDSGPEANDPGSCQGCIHPYRDYTRHLSIHIGWASILERNSTRSLAPPTHTEYGPMQLRYTLYRTWHRSNTHCAASYTHIRQTQYRATQRSDTPCRGSKTDQIYSVRGPIQLRYRLCGVLRSSDTHCISSYSDPMHAVKDPVQVRDRR